MTALVLSYLAGVLTTLNPCVLPVLPIILASAFSKGRLGPLALTGGMVLGFTLRGTALAATGQPLGLSDVVFRTGAAVLFVLFGLVLLVSAAGTAFAGTLQPVADAASTIAARLGSFGLAGQFATGALLGVVWTPCAGPALGAAVTLAAQTGGYAHAMIRMFAFSLGAASILLLLARGSQAAIMARRNRMMGVAERAKPALGAILIVVGVAVLTGFDKRLEAVLVNLMPEWLVAFTTSV